MSERQPYSRIYWSIIDDPKFATVYDDDRLVATWLRLLIVADQAHPASAYIPFGTNRKALESLVEVGLIDLGTGNRYRIHGLDKERARRRPVTAGPAPEPVQDWASSGPEPAQPSFGNQGLSQAEQSKDETSQDETRTARAPDPADVYWTLTGKYPKDRALVWIDELSSKYGPEDVIRALAKTHRSDPSANTLIGRTEDILRHESRVIGLKEQAAEKQRQKERRPTSQTEEERAAIQAEIRKLMEVAA